MDNESNQLANIIYSPSTNWEMNNDNMIFEKFIDSSSGQWSVEKKNCESNVNTNIQSPKLPHVKTLDFNDTNTKEGSESKNDIQGRYRCIVNTILYYPLYYSF